MRQTASILLVALLWGCGPSSVPPATTPTSDGPLTVAPETPAADGLGDGEPTGDGGGFVPDELPDLSTDADLTPQSLAQLVSGSVYGTDNYRLYSLGPSAAGDHWSLRRTSPGGGSFVVVLFDEQHDLLTRGVLGHGQSLGHTLREGTTKLHVAVAPAYGSGGGEFSYTAEATTGNVIPAPQSQIVYLNFAGATGVSVNYRGPISFGPFDAASLGPAYAGQTETIKQIIVDEVRRDYAGFAVQILSSDDGPPPAEPHSTVHFGGEGDGLLGLADSVDHYNRDVSEEAMIYVETFGIYAVMELTTGEMAQMVANTASHELGHLLGLYHTSDPTEIMDTTAGAWELTEDQQFRRSPLYEGVFPYGYEDCPKLLSQSVGFAESQAERLAKAESYQRAIDRLLMRELAREELPCRCGNCRQRGH